PPADQCYKKISDRERSCCERGTFVLQRRRSSAYAANRGAESDRSGDDGSGRDVEIEGCDLGHIVTERAASHWGRVAARVLGRRDRVGTRAVTMLAHPRRGMPSDRGDGGY